MAKLRDKDVEKMMSGGTVPPPPTYLTERIKSEIPHDLRLRREAAERFPLTSFSVVYRQFMVMAAAIGIVVGVTLFVLHAMKRIDDDKRRQVDLLLEMLEHDENAPRIVVPAPPVARSPMPQRRPAPPSATTAAAGARVSAPLTALGETAPGVAASRMRPPDDSGSVTPALPPTATPEVVIGGTGGETDVIFVIGDNITAPLLVERVEPAWPPAARAAHRQGNVVVEIVVGKDGRVSDGRVLYDGAGLGCADAVLDAVRRWKYRPASRSGRPVAVYVKVTVTFGTQ